jgi:hypothetical protein
MSTADDPASPNDPLCIEPAPTTPASLAHGEVERAATSVGDRVLSFITAAALVTLVATVGISYGRALTYPGEASIAVRTVDWIRDHGGGPVVDAVENWVYSRHHDETIATLSVGPSTTSAPPALRPLAPNAAAGDGEGRWEALPTDRDSGHVGFATFLRPDPDHPDVRVGVAMFDQRLVSAHLVAGTKEPVADPVPDRGQVPPQIRPQLVATFNSGYKSIDAHGGYYADHHELRTLRIGAASAVIDDTGTLSVGQWGRDVVLGPHITAVRQNLELIVDQGRPVVGLATNLLNRWGADGGQRQFTWRSAIGTDPAGHLYYIAGDQLTLPMLAHALAAAGATRGMELDIHPNMVHLFTYHHDRAGTEPTPSKLLDTMHGPADRYLVPDSRDFFALTHR